jgi:DNA-binding NarL/FixJ family response regulator
MTDTDTDSARVRVVLVDDHPMFLDGLRSLMARVEWVDLVGEALTAGAAVDMVLDREPDVVMMDLQLPDGSGIEATRSIVSELPGTGVLVLTMFDDDDSVFAAMRAGARGYLLKGADRDEIVRALRAVADGEAIFGPGIARRVPGPAPPAGLEPATHGLGNRRSIL